MRVTAILRGLLLLDLAERHIQVQRKRLVKMLARERAEIIQIDEDETEFCVKYRENDWTNDAIFMRAMLDAELSARMQLGGKEQ